MTNYKKAAVFAKPQGEIGGYLRALLSLLTDAGVEPYLDRMAAEYFPEGAPFPVLSDAALGETCDIALVIGGDGRMLGAARALWPHNLPIIGINAGRLGFITDVTVEDMARQIPLMLAGHAVKDERRFLFGRIYRDNEEVFSSPAVNDITLTHGHALGMVQYTVYVDGQQMSVQRADGVLVSSSTGSTAYAMAAGGPIMHPAVHSMLLVPIAPHTLSNRPVVMSSASTIDIEINETRSALVSFDAQTSFDVAAGDVLRVTVGAEAFTMLHPEGYNYFELLRRKLKWNYLPQAEHPIHTPEGRTKTADPYLP